MPAPLPDSLPAEIRRQLRALPKPKLGPKLHKRREARETGGADGTVDPREVEKFAAIAERWWDPEGDFRPLHMLNPVRLGYIRDRLCARFGCDPKATAPLAGLTVCDIGCGGGLICEPLTRLGASVTGIDATARSIEIARTHAEAMGLSIDYRHVTADALATEGRRFDAVINMEVVEHVADRNAFLRDAAALVKPEGAMVLSTFNRTPKSFALGIVGAEYILRWLPRGTHDWRKFVKPSELAAGLRPAGMTVADLCGMVYDPIRDEFSLAPRDLDVNYLAFAVPA
jgi:2-polyprenyl-6-hydroxyphenyl methylase/3-demethylubiquinone-9 3-methyltransferase